MVHKCDGCRYKGEHHEMGFRPFGVCNREVNLLEAERNYNADKCPYRKTNADRIRAEIQTDEGLAKRLIQYMDDRGEWATPVGQFDDREEAIARTVEWLKQPAEGEQP